MKLQSNFYFKSSIQTISENLKFLWLLPELISNDEMMQAFEAAWATACKVHGSVMVVPAEFEFLVGPISFSGPYCQPNIIFQVIYLRTD